MNVHQSVLVAVGRTLVVLSIIFVRKSRSLRYVVILIHLSRAGMLSNVLDLPTKPPEKSRAKNVGVVEDSAKRVNAKARLTNNGRRCIDWRILEPSELAGNWFLFILIRPDVVLEK